MLMRRLVFNSIGQLSEHTLDGVDQPLSLGKKAVNLFGASVRVVTAVAQNKRVLVSIGEQARRFVICEACEFYNGKTCSKCGCVIKFKAVLQTEHCPVGKW